jgi:hypothetical protein
VQRRQDGISAKDNPVYGKNRCNMHLKKFNYCGSSDAHKYNFPHMMSVWLLLMQSDDDGWMNLTNFQVLRLKTAMTPYIFCVFSNLCPLVDQLDENYGEL